MKAEIEFILQCNRNCFIEQVMYARQMHKADSLLNQPLLFCLSPEYLEAGRRFVEMIRLAGKAENFELEIQLQDEKYIFTFSGVLLRDDIMIVAQQPYAEAETNLPVPELVAEEVEETLAGSSENLQPEKPEDVNVWELLDEMSRLNNELINTKRELIQKNMELERLYQQLKKG
jgi:hypothetical protein